jgi:hypothetical protein
MSTVRDVILDNLPDGCEEAMGPSGQPPAQSGRLGRFDLRT